MTTIENTYIRIRTDHSHQLLDSAENPLATFNLGGHGLSTHFIEALLRAFEGKFGHTTVSAQRQSFRGILRLVCYLKDSKLAAAPNLPEDLAMGFHRWLLNQDIKDSTRQTLQNIAISVIRWWGRNFPTHFTRAPTFNVPGFKREDPAPKNTLSEAQTKRILGVCYDEIELIEARLARRSELSSSASEVDRLTARVGEATPNHLPTQQELRRLGSRAFRLLAASGGICEVRRKLYFTYADVIPFYCAILVQTMGNPDAITRLSRKEPDVVCAHPLRKDIEYFRWDKPRANREQQIDCPVGKEWSVANIYRRLLALNSDLAKYVPKGEQNYAFIAAPLKTQSVTLPSVQSLHNYLREFIERHSLPNFDFWDWRPSGGKAHRLATGSVVEASRKLNHKRIRTTARYTPASDDRQNFDYKIVKFQGELVRRGRGERNQESDKAHSEAFPEYAQTVFGFGCKNPTAGFNSTVPSGTRCYHFEQCASCSGSLIPIDNPAVVAKILSAKQALDAAHIRALKEGWLPRFNVLYASTRTAIDEDIFPKISQPILKLAMALVDPSQIPWLE